MRVNVDSLTSRYQKQKFLSLICAKSTLKSSVDIDEGEYPVILYRNSKEDRDPDDYISTYNLDHIISRLSGFMESLDYTLLGYNSHVSFYIPIRIIYQDNSEKKFEIFVEKQHALFKRLTDPDDLVLIEGRTFHNVPIFKVRIDKDKYSILIPFNEYAIEALMENNNSIETFFRYPISKFSIYGFTRYGLKRVKIDNIHYTGSKIYVLSTKDFLDLIKKIIESENKEISYVI